MKEWCMVFTSVYEEYNQAQDAKVMEKDINGLKILFQWYDIWPCLSRCGCCNQRLTNRYEYWLDSRGSVWMKEGLEKDREDGYNQHFNTFKHDIMHPNFGETCKISLVLFTLHTHLLDRP